MIRGLRRTAFALGVVLGILHLNACAPGGAGSDSGPATALRVLVEPLAPQPMWRMVEVAGFIESRHDVVLSAETSGRVAECIAEEGAVVRSGDALLRLDDVQARLKRDLAKSAFDEASLHADTPASARAAREIEWRLAQDILERCTIRAPFAGTFERRSVEVGVWVAPGTPVARLVDYTALRVFVHLAEDEAVAIRPGSRATFTVDAFGEAEFGAVVTQVAGAAEAETRKFRVELSVVPEPRIHRVGHYARVRLPAGDGAPALIIPKARTFWRYEQCFAWTIDRGDVGHIVVRERRLTVAPLLGDKERLHVLSGLAEGAEVVTAPMIGLRDGMAVVPTNGKE